jgi:hypothetical protein
VELSTQAAVSDRDPRRQRGGARAGGPSPGAISPTGPLTHTPVAHPVPTTPVQHTSSLADASVLSALGFVNGQLLYTRQDGGPRPSAGAADGGAGAAAAAAAAKVMHLGGVSGLVPATDDKPTSSFVTPMLTDMYQVRGWGERGEVWGRATKADSRAAGGRYTPLGREGLTRPCPSTPTLRSSP